MKTILITGSTDGIGKLTATKLAADQHQVILHGRNDAKLKQTIAEIKTLSQNENISGYVADLSDFDSVHQMTADISKEHTKIDVLINNAGVFKSPVSETDQGLDIRFAVNFLAPQVLTNDLLPLIKKSDEPRIINLSSAAQASVSLSALAGDESLGFNEAYAQSKLAITMWSFWLANQETNLNVIAVNPGSLLNTKMVQEAYGQSWSKADKGADILCELATSAAHQNANGKYFDNDQGSFSKAHPDAYNTELIAQLISESDKLINYSNEK